MSGLDEFKERYRRSLQAFIQGDPEPQTRMSSRQDDVTLSNPLGPPAKGVERVFEATDGAAAAIREGDGLTYDVTSFYETPDLAYELALQGGRMKLGGSPDMVPVMLSVTSVFRREDDVGRSSTVMPTRSRKRAQRADACSPYVAVLRIAPRRAPCGAILICQRRRRPPPGPLLQ
jgi:ketosteroid isomerase-like protein